MHHESHRPYRRVLGAALLLTAGLLAAACGPVATDGTGPQLKKGQELGDVTLTGLDGQPVRFKALTGGKVALVDVWATWCAPCIAAMPHLQALHNRFKDDGFTVVGVMTDRNATTIGPDFLKAKKTSYPMVMDDDGEAIQSILGPISGIPMLVLVDREGRVVKVFQGFGGPDILERAVNAALRDAGAPAPAA